MEEVYQQPCYRNIYVLRCPGPPGSLQNAKKGEDHLYHESSAKIIKIFGVTALTSLSDDDTSAIFQRTAFNQVKAMLDLAQEAQIDGVVCSPHELDLVVAQKSLLSITPGIRLSESSDDQSRVMTPKDAISKGADYIVIGRPITNAPNISEALQEIHNSIWQT